MSKPYESMYRALVRRSVELAVDAEHDENPAVIVAELRRLAVAHEDLAGLPSHDWDHASVADHLEAESLQPTPPPPT